PLVNGVDVAVKPDHARQTQPTTSRILYPPLPQRVAEYVLCNTKKPGKRRPSVLSAEPTSAEPGSSEDFGCQIGGIAADQGPRPRKHLTDVPVIHLRERIGITRSQEFRVRRSSEVASHNLYFAAPQKVCQPRQVSQARQGCRGLLLLLFGRARRRTGSTRPVAAD